jgi:hypothetical protein
MRTETYLRNITKYIDRYSVPNFDQSYFEDSSGAGRMVLSDAYFADKITGAILPF